MSILEILDKIKGNSECMVYSPCGLPTLSAGEILPEDVREFYENCGGVVLFQGKKHGFTIVGPMEVQPANPIIVGELCEEDISSKWYIVCKDVENNYITIDISKKRLGKCYDSFWDRHGVVGECAVVAESFTELIMQLYKNQGESLYWLEDDFVYLGDAYDEEL